LIFHHYNEMLVTIKIDDSDWYSVINC
jgi:hypothetical protein